MPFHVIYLLFYNGMADAHMLMLHAVHDKALLPFCNSAETRHFCRTKAFAIKGLKKKKKTY